jgi:hypothetical protein
VAPGLTTTDAVADIPAADVVGVVVPVDGGCGRTAGNLRTGEPRAVLSSARGGAGDHVGAVAAFVELLLPSFATARKP